MARLDELRLNVSPVLTGVALGYAPGGLIADKVLPVLPVSSDVARLPRYTVDTLRLTDDARALRAAPAQIVWNVTYTDVTLAEHTVDVPLDWREVRTGQAVGIDYLAKSVRTAKLKVVLNREAAVASVLQNPANYAAGHTETPAAGSGWNEKTSGQSNVDPVEIMLYGVEVIRAATGQRPNVAWFGPSAWWAVQTNTHVRARLAYAPTTLSAMQVTPEAFAAAIQVDNVFVGNAVSASGGTATDIWSDYVGLAYVEPKPSLVESPTFGFLAMEQFGFDPELSAYGFASTWTEAGQFVQHVAYTELYAPFIAMPEAGYLWIDVVK